MNKATQLSSQNNTLNLDIEGMTCAACAARIERVISKQEDVLDVSVSFPLKSAIVDIKNNDEFDVDNLIKNVPDSVLPFKELNKISNLIQNSVEASESMKNYAVRLWTSLRDPSSLDIKIETFLVLIGL